MRKNLWKHTELCIILIGILVVLFSVASADPINLGQSGWVKLDDGKYYGDENGYAVIGHQQIDDDYYYFDTSGLLRTEWHIVHCKPGSSTEQYALLRGLPYDNGQKRVVGISITDVNQKADWIIKNYISSGMTEREKAQVLHNWLIYNAHYDYTYSNYNASGVLIQGTGVCDSYSRAYCLLLSKVGIENKRITGIATNSAGEVGGHAWTLVKIDGQWYHVDCTWDDPGDSGVASFSGSERNVYFLVGDSYIKRSRSFDDESISADNNCVGWVEMGNEKYYYGSEGKRTTGWLIIEGLEYKYNQEAGAWERVAVPRHYYFNDKGVMQTGLQQITGKTYLFDDNGQLQTGWVYFSAESGYRYYNDDGEMQTGWFTEEDYSYYLRADGLTVSGLQTIDGKTYYFLDSGRMMTGWQYFYDESGYRYFNDKGEMLTGWYTEEDNIYYFFTNGLVASGLQEVDGALYMFSDYYGLQKNTWWNVEENEYYFGSDGKAATGFTVIDGKTFCFSEQHILQTGWLQLNETNFGYIDWCLGLILGQDAEIDGSIYRFDENGNLIGRVVSGGYYSPEQILEVKAERDENGNLQVVTTGKILGIPLGWTGWGRYQWSTWYYGDENGYALIGLHNIDGKPYCFNEQGELTTGWIKVNDKWYYADNSGIAAHNGWQEIGNVWYYFYADGEMATGWLNDGGTYYYMKNDGSMQTGWVKDKGKWYYLNSNGTLKTGWLNDSGNWYYLLSDGQLAIGWICDSGAYYYMNKNGLMLTGWIEDGGKWYYMNESGVMQTGWLKSGNNWYYLRSSGELASGWQQISGQWYYFKKSGTMASGEWIEDKDAEAKLPTGQKRELWYWFDDNGKMAVGWKEIKGQWEMFSDGGEWLYTWNGN